MTKLLSEVVIHTDGACEPNPGPGGWAAILQFQTSNGIHQKEVFGSHPSTTNNRMEIMGVIESLKLLKRPCDVTVFSDSRYVVNSVGDWLNGNPSGNTGWITGWKKYGWRRKDGALQNVDLWKEIDALVRLQKSLRMKWIRGHSGHELNERCDVLAVEARRKIKNATLDYELQPPDTQDIFCEDQRWTDL